MPGARRRESARDVGDDGVDLVGFEHRFPGRHGRAGDATPIDLAALIPVNKPVVRARYEFAKTGEGDLAAVVESLLERSGLACREE